MHEKHISLENLDTAAFLEQVLTASEVEDLNNIKHELNICIKWGVLTQHIADWLITSLDAMVFLEDEKSSIRVVKRNPYEALFDRDQKRITGDSEKKRLAKKYVLLQLLKKLLGALKTHVNQELSRIEIIDEETEEEIKALLPGKADEEEMDLAAESNTLAKDTEIIAKISAGENRGCHHNRLSIRQIRADQSTSGCDELHHFCKDCRQIIQKDVLGSRTKTKKRILPSSFSRECQHSKVQWKEGEEGRVAMCSHCKSPIPDPKRYRWTEVGLEPFGDDPQQDEIVRIKAVPLEVAV